MWDDCYAHMTEDWWVFLLLAFLINVMFARTIVSLACCLLWLIIFELVVILIAFRFWDPLVRIGVLVAAILGLIVGRALCGHCLFDDEIWY